MKPEQYNRAIELLCPTCGCSQFSSEASSDDNMQIVNCVSCKREFIRSDLVRDNSENINAHSSEIIEQIRKDIANEFSKMINKTFKNNKNIRIK